MQDLATLLNKVYILIVDTIHAGVIDYLSKPFQPKELDYRVIKLLGKINFD